MFVCSSSTVFCFAFLSCSHVGHTQFVAQAGHGSQFGQEHTRHEHGHRQGGHGHRPGHRHNRKCFMDHRVPIPVCPVKDRKVSPSQKKNLLRRPPLLDEANATTFLSHQELKAFQVAAQHAAKSSVSSSGQIVLYANVKFGAPQEGKQDWGIQELLHFLCRFRFLGVIPLIAVLSKNFAEGLKNLLPSTERDAVVDLSEMYEKKMHLLIDSNCFKFVFAGVLLELGFDAFYTDLDILWLSNPVPVLGNLTADHYISMELDPDIFNQDWNKRRKSEIHKFVHEIHDSNASKSCPQWCISFPRHLKNNGEYFQFSAGTGNTGQLFFRNTAGTRTAISKSIARCYESNAPRLGSDQDAHIDAIRQLCGTQLQCYFLPALFGKSAWGVNRAAVTQHFDTIDDKPIARILLQGMIPDAAADSCAKEMRELQMHVLGKPLDECRFAQNNTQLACSQAFDFFKNGKIEKQECHNHSAAIQSLTSHNICTGLELDAEDQIKLRPWWCQHLQEVMPAEYRDLTIPGVSWLTLFIHGLLCGTPPRDKFFKGESPIPFEPQACWNYLEEL